MKYDDLLLLYLENFTIRDYPLLFNQTACCHLCGATAKCSTTTFAHVKTGFTLVRRLCGSCVDTVLKMHSRLKAKEDIDAESPHP